MVLNSILLLSSGQYPNNLSPYFSEEGFRAAINKIESMYDFKQPRMQMSTISDLINIIEDLNIEAISRDKAIVKLLGARHFPK